MTSYRDLHAQQKVVNLEIKDNILKALDAVEACGSYAATGGLNYPMPFDIHIRKTDGVIQCPLKGLDQEGFKKIKSQARKAPYGKGSQTIVDQKVRYTYELDAEQFELQPTQKFDAWWKSLLAKVSKSLGVDASNMDVHRYKMLLYPPGGMFKAHTDSEKEPGMFGTLVITLPSRHDGGDVVLRHAGHKTTYRSSDYRFSWAAWYSDVRHEVKPVESGARWVLTFNLCARPPPVNRPLPSTPNVERHEAVIHKALAAWLSVPGSPRWPYLIYELDHDYTLASIKFNTLKGRDKVRAQILDKLSKKELKGKYKLFIALLEMEEHGDCYFDYDHEVGSKNRYGGYRAPQPPPDWHEFREIESTRRTMTLLDLDGEDLDDNLEFDSGNFLQKTAFSKGTKGEEGYTGYMGNYGPEATHWYRTTALVICSWSELDYLFPAGWEHEEEAGGGSEESEDQEEKQVKSAVRAPPPTAAVRRPLNVRRVAVPVAGGKRKIVELIDLTGDSD
ncbi:hypothetical protein QBC40DRAFT_332331 [Triangularia verruculosa]|uniref:Fe2OG dioxygenase domain-containing protein n=1 Tax=Triangularia verruculosa TaxID=2587418 RepID=A0AAN7ATH5_9PEZI|nr:hypothetical protein QBC40DRAFT_332331 [Triangularia verruculosa]